MAGGKPTYQWIETGPLAGQCVAKQKLTPAIFKAEVWMAIAGGANGIGYFTYTWSKGVADSFNVSQDIQSAMLQTDTQIQSYAPVLLSPQLPVAMNPNGSIAAGARLYDGNVYVIAVNSSPDSVTANFTVPR